VNNRDNGTRGDKSLSHLRLAHAAGALVGTVQAAPRRRTSAGEGAQWRRVIRRELAWILALKFAALALLWLLFFSPAHRSHVDREAANRQFAVTGAAAARIEPLRHSK